MTISDFRLLIPASILWVHLILLITYPQIVWILFIVECIIVLALILILGLSHRAKKILGGCFVALLLCNLSSLNFSLQTKALFPPNIVGHTLEVPIAVTIKSTPTMSSNFGKTRCSYQGEADVPHMYLTVLTSQTSQISDDEICELQYGAKYLFTDGKYTEDDFHVKNAATLDVSSVAKHSELEMIRAPPFIDYHLNLLRNKFLENAKKLPQSGSGLVPGMSIGDTRYLDKSLNDATKTSGLTHLTAISGSHFVIVISLVGSLFFALGLSRKQAGILQIIAVAAMVALVHPTDSVKRAAIMSTIGIMSIFAGRRSQSINVLSVVTIGWLCFDPWLAISYGFALSCLATFSIVMFSKPCTGFLSPLIGKTASELLAIPIVAQIGCYPVLLLMNDYLTPWAPLANLAVLPAIEFATILSLLSCLLSPIWTSGSFGVGVVASWFTDWIAWCAVWFSKWPFAKIPWIKGLPGALLLFGIIAGFFAIPKAIKNIWMRQKGYAPSEFSSPIHRFEIKRNALWKKMARGILKFPKCRPILSIFIVIGIIISASSIVYIKNFTYLFSGIPSNWLIAACPIGQGDSTALRTGTSSAILIDTGPVARKGQSEITVDACLKSLKVTRLDMIVLSHFHEDHVGNLNLAIKGREVDQIVTTAYHYPKPQYENVMRTAANNGIELADAIPGTGSPDICHNGYCVNWKIIDVLHGDSKEPQDLASADNYENDSSVAMLFTINGYTYFTSGDHEIDGDKEDLAKLREQGIKNIDIQKVNHHGSKTQNKELIKMLNPRVAIFPVGVNTYGHPSKDALKIYEDLGSEVLRTDENGICGVYEEIDREGSRNLMIFGAN